MYSVGLVASVLMWLAAGSYMLGGLQCNGRREAASLVSVAGINYTQFLCNLYRSGLRCKSNIGSQVPHFVSKCDVISLSIITGLTSYMHALLKSQNIDGAFVPSVAIPEIIQTELIEYNTIKIIITMCFILQH